MPTFNSNGARSLSPFLLRLWLLQSLEPVPPRQHDDPRPLSPSIRLGLSFLSSHPSPTSSSRSGTVESRLRQLVMKLEFVDTLVLAHPYIKGFDRTSYCVDDVEQRAVSVGEVPPAVATRTEADLVEGQGGTVWTTTFYIGLMIERRPGALEFVLVGLKARRACLQGLC